ncbi:MAG: cation:proton antiporter [Acidobacteria bacterium]|nr:cation:proton antiporter [Acidobacteriota bacterium]
MSEHALLAGLIPAYAVALVLIVLFARLRIPAIVAMILAGIAAGPHGLAFVATQSEVDLMAEIGIVLLLFTVGLDFSLAEMRRLWRATLAGGLLQVTVTAGLVAALLVAFSTVAPRVAVFAGLFVSLSSTAIVLKEMGSRNELGSPAGRLTTGVLLFQDLSIVVLLLMVPILAGQAPAGRAGEALLRAAVALAIVAGVGRLVLPLFVRWVLRSGRREAFPLAILLASVGTAWASSLLGVSMALGAFLGGLVLAESEFSHQAHAEIRPLRDILSSLFFISLGMLLHPAFVLRAFPWIAAALLTIVVVKALAAAAVLMPFAPSARVAIAAGIALAQVGEFSFVLGRAGLQAGLLPPDVWQTLLAASIGTMMLTPALLAFAPGIAARLTGRRRPAPREGLSSTLADHVIVMGYGAGGRLITKTLKKFGVPYLVLDLNGAAVREARTAGESIMYADAANPHSLRAAGIGRARALALVLSDADASLRVVKVARDVAPAIPVIVRTRYRGEARRMEEAGATVAVAEEIETSLEVLAQLLARVNIPGNLIETTLDMIRHETESLRPVRAPSRPMDAVSAISQSPVATHVLSAGDWAVGRTIADVNLRAETGALVVALESQGHRTTSPAAAATLNAGDVLYLMGDPSDILLARRRLTRG